jgi:hypothetical protein
MSALEYVGPGAMLARSIVAPFDDDPNWLDPAVPEPDDGCWIMGRGIVIPSEAVLTFAFYDANSVELPGGTADGWEFYVANPFGFGFGINSPLRGVVRKGQAVAGMLLSKGWYATIVGPQKHGLHLSNITPPAGAVKLCLSVQQRPPR